MKVNVFIVLLVLSVYFYLVARYFLREKDQRIADLESLVVVKNSEILSLKKEKESEG
jgi:hypothetical protein